MNPVAIVVPGLIATFISTLVGVIFCKAALQGASLNVFINTKSMKNREYAEELNAKAEAMLAKYTVLADEVFAQVRGRLN